MYKYKFVFLSKYNIRLVFRYHWYYNPVVDDTKCPATESEPGAATKRRNLLIAPIIALSGREKEGLKTWRDLGFRETYRLWKRNTIRQLDGAYRVKSLSRPNVDHEVSFTLSSCDCEHFAATKQTCIHMMLAVRRDLEHRKEDAKRTDAARAKAQKKERIRFTPEQIEANLARMGGVA